MEAWGAIFRNLYTGFLLRDFVGKIVPGVFLLFSVCSVFCEPRRLLAGVRKDLPLFVVVLCAGFAWTITLGTQSIAEGIGIWRYFPDQAPTIANNSPHVGFWSSLFFGGDEASFERDTLIVDEFQKKASEDEEQQYERFVVIKEACGNLFVAGLFSIPAWSFIFFTQRLGSTNHRSTKVKSHVSIGIGFVYFALIMLGLHRMHSQHVTRQLAFANDLVEKHKADPTKRQ